MYLMGEYDLTLKNEFKTFLRRIDGKQRNWMSRIDFIRPQMRYTSLS